MVHNVVAGKLSRVERRWGGGSVQFEVRDNMDEIAKPLGSNLGQRKGLSVSSLDQIF